MKIKNYKKRSERLKESYAMLQKCIRKLNKITCNKNPDLITEYAKVWNRIALELDVVNNWNRALHLDIIDYINKGDDIKEE